MIKFFRKIRQKLISENKSGKYFKYAIGEVILVVIGILIALAINNWNTQRINDKRNNELLIKLSKELDLNIERAILLDTTGDSFGDRLIFSDSLLNILDRGIRIEDLDYMQSQLIFYVNTFNLNTSVFEELKNTASLYSIGSDHLVTEIQRYYQLCDRESFYNLNYSDRANSLLDKCNEGWYDFKYMYRQNPENAIKYHQWLFNPRAKDYIYFRQFVNYVKIHSELILNKLKGIIKKSEELKKMIAEEQKSL
ncbi:DUF6090 family protein [Winogradskyella immobilis]|uniref:Phage abortive infection protein n=1 Tax=Winogradskyella immobilis TaxID=2816852 RepID=A0ABS8EMZ4_9FLAO|nr:DUF6090 family protein [Winogradskyella immobilis]MCC1484470.1 hypothetical protein [Winogradskyella immobilis]MCG0016562.1 hypothetical protein [Winogradskyella immobilis]